MKLYLSSYKIGNKADELKNLVSKSKKAAYIPNAMDSASRVQSKEERMTEDLANLKALDFEVEVIDLKDYFGKQNELKEKLLSFGLIWACGGNTFVLRRAMKLSGFDEIIHELKNEDIVYGGYSAGCCVLAPTLKGMHIVDNPEVDPYGSDLGTIWDGLNIINFSIAPHYKSDHPESADVDKEVDFMEQNNIPFKTLSDGQVIIIDSQS